MLRRTIVIAIAAALMTPAYPASAQAQEDSRDRFRAAGEIESIDPDESTFTLHTVRGETIVIHVNDSTRYHSRGGEIGGLTDLQIGMRAAAAGLVRDGVYLAKQVAAAAPGDGRRFARAAGEVIHINRARSSFTILTRSGEELTLGVEPRTRWFSRDGSVQELADLERGTLVRAAYVQTDDRPVALAVQVAIKRERVEREALRENRRERLRVPSLDESK